MVVQRIETPLSGLLSDLTIPPPLATKILDSHVDDTWNDAIVDLEYRLNIIKARARVKAARDLGQVAEGLRIVVGTAATVHISSLLSEQYH